MESMKLSRSQRVKIIQDTALHLESGDWATIDLVLKQFGFPTEAVSYGDRKSYTINMISDGTDEDLVELGQHFGIKFEGGESELIASRDTPYWQDGHLRVFISHLAHEREYAAHLRTALKCYGMSGFVAHNDINPTSEWQVEIETSLSTCDILVALFHKDFISSKWCDQEIGYGLGRGIPVFAVRYGTDPHGFVSRFQAFNGNGKTSAQVAKELFEASIIHKKLQDKMAEIVINLFVNSDNFAEAKERIGYVERLKKMG